MSKNKKVVVYCQYHLRTGFHTLLRNISLYLKNFLDYELVELQENPSEITIGEKRITIQDCEMLIHHPEEDIMKVISFADNDTYLNTLMYDRNNKNDLIIMAHHGHSSLSYRHQYYNFKFKPTIYVQENPLINLDHFYMRRQLSTDRIDKFVFRGNVNNMGRNSIYSLKDSEYFHGGGEKLLDSEYFYEIIQYKAGLCIPGVAEFCHRDVEYMAIGLPILKLQYVSDCNPKLIPNYHYISIDRFDKEEDKDFNGGVIAKERCGGPEYADRYVKRFLEVKDNTDFLQFISKNARNYYVEHMHTLSVLKSIINLLEI